MELERLLTLILSGILTVAGLVLVGVYVNWLACFGVCLLLWGNNILLVDKFKAKG